MAGTIAPAADEPGDAIEVFRAAAEAARQTADAAVPGNALAMTSSPEDAAAVKVRLAGAHKEIALAKKTALEAQKAAKELIEQKKRELEQMMRDANALLEPLQKQMDRLQDGIGAVNLYLGRDEEIIPVREGERAPSDEVVLIRQTTLHMDEETAFLADEGGMDFSNIGDFIQWLQDDQTHVDQIIPEMKGVVALQPRKRWKDYTGDAFVDARLNEANRETFWLIRNGENLWLTTAPFSVGAHAVPRADLFTDMFVETVGGERRPMQPGSSAWIRAEEAADQLTRHYMKVALLLQGLVDRTKVFHPLPASGLSFIDQSAYDRGVVRVITDDENVLAAVRQPFDEWLKERTANLDTGMRVVGSFGWGRGFRLYDDKKNYEHANVHPRGAQPADGIYTIKRINDDYFDFSFTFDREDEVYDRYRGYSKAKRKATGKFSAGDKFVLPLDNVTIEEMEEYLAARSERKHYQVMFPLLRAAIAFKRQELTDEQPFRDALVAVLAQTAGYDDLDGVGRTADDLIRWYKTANKWHRPLNADDAKASRLILAEHKRRQTPTSEATLSAIRGTAPDAIVIARRTNDYIAVVPEVRRYAEPAAPENVWVTIITFDGAGKEKNRNSWQQLTRAQVAKWSILHTTDAWSSWMLDPNKETRLTDDDIDLFIDTILHRPETLRGTGRVGTAVTRTSTPRSACSTPNVERTATGTPSGRRCTSPATTGSTTNGTPAPSALPPGWSSSSGRSSRSTPRTPSTGCRGESTRGVTFDRTTSSGRTTRWKRNSPPPSPNGRPAERQHGSAAMPRGTSPRPSASSGRSTPGSGCEHGTSRTSAMTNCGTSTRRRFVSRPTRTGSPTSAVAPTSSPSSRDASSRQVSTRRG